MSRNLQPRVEPWLLLATAMGLFGCPLLLDDEFSFAALAEGDAGTTCVGAGCLPQTDAAGGSSGAHSGAGSGGSSGSGAGGASASGNGGTTAEGSGGAAGADTSSGGVSGAETGGSSGQPSTGPDAPCWTLELSPESYDPESNCIGIHGTSKVTTDSGTTLQLSYDNGDPCFAGSIASTGWGAVYELTFAGDDDGSSRWNASNAGVAGFEFRYRGGEPPASLRVIYKDTSGVDHCRVISGSTTVAFSEAHPECAASGSTVDSTRLMEMILAFPVRTSSYEVDFCVQIRALD